MAHAEASQRNGSEDVMGHSLPPLSLCDNAPHEKEETQVINLPSTMTLPKDAVKRLDFIKEANEATRSFAVKASIIEGSLRLARKLAGMLQSDTEIHSQEISATTSAMFAVFCLKYGQTSDAMLNTFMEIAEPFIEKFGLDYRPGMKVQAGDEREIA